MTNPMETMWSPKDNRYQFSHCLQISGYLVKAFERLDLALVALLVLQAQAVEVLFQQEGNTVIDDTEQKQINSKQDSGHPKVYRLILEFVIERRTKIDLEHYPDIIYRHHPGHQFKKAHNHSFSIFILSSIGWDFFSTARVSSIE